MKNILTLFRPFALASALLLGIFFPQLSQFDALIPWALMVMLYVVALQINIRELMPQRSHFYLVIANILIGLIPALILIGMGYKTWGLIAFFIGMTPTANAAPVVVSFLGGRVNYALTAFLMSNISISLAMIVLIPLLLNVDAPFAEMQMVLIRLCWVMGVPLLLGALTQKYLPKITQYILVHKKYKFILWLISLSIIVAKGSLYCRENQEDIAMLIQIAGMAGAFCVINFSLGAWIGGKKFRREASQCLGQKNTLYTTYLALAFASPLIALGPTFYIFFHNMWNAIQLFDVRYNKKKASLQTAKTPSSES